MAIDTIFALVAPKGHSSLKTSFQRAWRACRAWYVKRQTRYCLLNLTEEQLQDIGISRDDARREAGKSFFWDMNA